MLLTPLMAAALLLTAAVADAQSLRGSRASLHRQKNQARAHDFTFIKSAAQVRRFVAAGILVRVGGNSDYELSGVSHSYARPATKLFIERLSAQLRAACAERLTVTSLTRPLTEQPSNASALSVHPTGMAVDLRVPASRRCRAWLERVLVSLEDANVLEATRERRPRHYHVAVFPTSYERYLASRKTPRRAYVGRKGDSLPATARANGVTVEARRAENGRVGDPIMADQTIRVASHARGTYRVKPGDSLASIARRFGTTVAALRQANGLGGDRIVAGQILLVTSR